MRRIILTAFALTLSAPALANAPEPMPASSAVEAAYSYGLTADGPNVKDMVSNLNRLCESKRPLDRKRCARAWGKINDAYAKLQAERGGAGR